MPPSEWSTNELNMEQWSNRKTIRLKNHDYSAPGYYFITINVEKGRQKLGQIKDGDMVLNKYGRIVHDYWMELPKFYSNCILDEFVVMPDHVHGIIQIILEELHQKRISISTIIHGFKLYTARDINALKTPVMFHWQRSFYDHIMRDEQSLMEIRRYILENPGAKQ
jgi:putative transposase